MNDIFKHRMIVQTRIRKSFGCEQEDFEKAHQDGDIHPNGKWVWVGSANKGRGDWRTINGRANKKRTETTNKPLSKNNSTKVNVDEKISKNQTVASKMYSHNINGVNVDVSKNKDGSYTLSANGKKLEIDDPSFYKDNLSLRVKRALAKKLGL